MSSSVRDVTTIGSGPARTRELLRELWSRRELLAFFVKRNFKVRYRQTLLGVSWLVVQPLVLALVYTVFVGRLLRVSTEVPYHVFVLAGLIPWLFFSTGAQHGANSLVNDHPLISKVHFPRLVLPISGVAVHIIDLITAMAVLGLFTVLAGIPPRWTWFLVPTFLALAFMIALAVALPLGAFNVRYRDVQAGIGLLFQVWMFASPVVYPAELVPEVARPYYELNPLVGVVQGTRWALLGGTSFPIRSVALSVAVSVIALAVGIRIFARLQHTFADDI